MEAELSALARSANIANHDKNSPVVQRAMEYQRLLMAKRSNLGLSSTHQNALCLHLSCQTLGESVDVKVMTKLAGAKSKAQYLSTWQTVEKLLDIGQGVSIQEVATKLGVSHLVATAARVLKNYEDRLVKNLGPARSQNVSLDKPVYPCAAVQVACKIRGEKVAQPKLVELSRGKKKELDQIVEEMMESQPEKNDEKKRGVSKQLHFMEQVMGDVEEDTGAGEEVEEGKKCKVRELDDFEDDGFDEWKNNILRKAVSAGFTEYQKYLPSEV
jgi:hypothetical protein